MSDDLDTQANIKSLLKILKKKEARDALTVLAETKSETWVDIKNTVGDLKDIATMGGASMIVQTLQETMQLQLNQSLAPINNQLNAIVTDVLGPIYADLQALATDMASFVADGPTGAFWGSLVGSIWGELGQLIGGLLGSAVEQGIKLLAIWWRDEWPKLITEIIKNVKEWWAKVDIISDIMESFTNWYIDLIKDIAPGAAEFIDENRPIGW